ncbi:hypothetical protein ANAPC1_01375 [Anaplasma phagocytophilum]|uniref:Uncharacterized protein n=1 Tax=Anaplasma phagocytophilum TaxID=948 RepID=A0AA45ZI35_ANAPH|nr:hypothetical protein ANAPC1_01375 [Anaplasma phagocytophilum]SBO32941.1 hypothetical protein ANAPC4_00981 [Anaplasma phagocytophilum]SBO33065.1 hypothetical protein ANAPC3_01090 [Anaplasma phagocytophilum]SBO33619.1 hypothetical protein ANAPC2_01408 [Anaplasma phagocytophilum]
MMLLLIRLTSLVMLLLRYPGRTLFSLRMLLLEFLTLISKRGFVLRSVAQVVMITVSMRRNPIVRTPTNMGLQFAVVQAEQVGAGVERLRSI